MDLFQNPQFYPVGPYVYPYAKSTALITELAVSFKIVQYESSNFILFLKTVLDSLSPFVPYVNVIISLTFFRKKNPSGILAVIYINSGSTAILQIVSFYIRTQIAFPVI